MKFEKNVESNPYHYYQFNRFSYISLKWLGKMHKATNGESICSNETYSTSVSKDTPFYRLIDCIFRFYVAICLEGSEILSKIQRKSGLYLAVGETAMVSSHAVLVNSARSGRKLLLNILTPITELCGKENFNQPTWNRSHILNVVYKHLE